MKLNRSIGFLSVRTEPQTERRLWSLHHRGKKVVADVPLRDALAAAKRWHGVVAIDVHDEQDGWEEEFMTEPDF